MHIQQHRKAYSQGIYVAAFETSYAHDGISMTWRLAEYNFDIPWNCMSFQEAFKKQKAFKLQRSHIELAQKPLLASREANILASREAIHWLAGRFCMCYWCMQRNCCCKMLLLFQRRCQGIRVSSPSLLREYCTAQSKSSAGRTTGALSSVHRAVPSMLLRETMEQRPRSTHGLWSIAKMHHISPH